MLRPHRGEVLNSLLLKIIDINASEGAMGACVWMNSEQSNSASSPPVNWLHESMTLADRWLSVPSMHFSKAYWTGRCRY